MDTSPPERIDVSQPRLRKLVDMLRNRQAQDLISPARSGAPDDAGIPGAISIGGTKVDVPQNARMEVRVDENGRPGVQIASDYPLPNGTCVWVPCDAVAHAHDVVTAVAES